MSTAAAAESGWYVLCSVAGTNYAFRSEQVRHIEMVAEITPVPNAGGHLDGVVLSRGEIVPALSLRARFGFERVPHDSRTRIVFVQAGERCVGLIVDSAREFVRIAGEKIEPAGSAIASVSGNCVEAIANLGDRLVVVLDAAALLERGA